MLSKEKIAVIDFINAKGMKQKDLAEIWGTYQSVVSKVLNKKEERITLEKLLEYVRLIGYDVWIELEPSLEEVGTINVK